MSSGAVVSLSSVRRQFAETTPEAPQREAPAPKKISIPLVDGGERPAWEFGIGYTPENQMRESLEDRNRKRKIRAEITGLCTPTSSRNITVILLESLIFEPSRFVRSGLGKPFTREELTDQAKLDVWGAKLFRKHDLHPFPDDAILDVFDQYPIPEKESFQTFLFASQQVRIGSSSGPHVCQMEYKSNLYPWLSPYLAFPGTPIAPRMSLLYMLTERFVLTDRMPA